MRSVIESSFPTLSDKIVVTDGAYGNVKFSNTGVCVEHSGDECDASDPRPAWERSMVDMYLVGVSDVVMMLYQSKFGQAAILRADVRHGRRELYINTRITHSLVDPLVARAGVPGGVSGGPWRRIEGRGCGCGICSDHRETARGSGRASTPRGVEEKRECEPKTTNETAVARYFYPRSRGAIDGS